MRGRRPDARLEPFADREVRFARPDEEWPTGRRPVRQYSPPAHVARRPRSRSPPPRSPPPRRRSRERRSRSPPQRRARSPMMMHRDSPPRDFEREYYRYSPAPREFPEETYRFEAEERPERFDAPEFREWPPEHFQGGGRFERPVEAGESSWQLQIFIGNEQPHPGIPEFSGENPESSSRQFLKLIDELGNKENWTHEKRKKQFALKLVGPAKRWLLSGDGEKLVEFWGHLKTIFVKAFIDDMDYHYNLQQMINRTKRPDESYSNYFTCKLMLFKPLNITGRRAVSCLIGGLKNDENSALYDFCFDSPELLYSHLMAESQKPPTDPGFKECYHCHKSDHKARKCPERRHKERGLFVVKVNGYALNAENDLRSQYVTIKEHQADLCGIRHNNHKLLIQGFCGAMVSSLGHAFANLEVDGVMVNMQMHVVPNNCQNHPVVLGEMLRKHPEVQYLVDDKGPKFLRKEVKMHVPLTSSFALNEKLVEKRGTTSSGKAPPSSGSMQSAPSAADGHGNKPGRSSKIAAGTRGGVMETPGRSYKKPQRRINVVVENGKRVKMTPAKALLKGFIRNDGTSNNRRQ